jgi:cysteine synthase
LLQEVHDQINHVVFVTDAEALSMRDRMRDTEGLSIGPSAGATLAAFKKTVKRRPDLVPDALPSIAILPDRGEVYGSLRSRARRRPRQTEHSYV